METAKAIVDAWIAAYKMGTETPIQLSELVLLRAVLETAR